MSQTILAVSYSSKKLGAAYYDEDETKVYILPDVAEDEEFSVLSLLIRNVKPTQIIANKSQDAQFQTRIRREAAPAGEQNADDDSFSKMNITNSAPPALANNNTLSNSLSDSTTVYPNANEVPKENTGTPRIQNQQSPMRRDGEEDTNESGFQTSRMMSFTPTIRPMQNEIEEEKGSAKKVNNDEKNETAENVSASSIENPPKFKPGTPVFSQPTQKRPQSASSTQLVSSLLGPPTPVKVPKYQPTKGEEQFAIAQKDDEEEEGKEHEENFKWKPSISFLPNIAFSFGEARKKLEEMFIDGVRNEKLIASFRFDFLSTNMIRSLGALLRFMDHQRVGVEYEDFTSKTPIKEIQIIILDDFVEVDPTTVKALEIFHADYRPESIRQKFVWGHNRKEGMSIFKLCNLCRSTPGKHILRHWFDRPTRSREILNARLDGISFFYHDCNIDAASYIRNQMKDIAFLKSLFKRMQRGNVTVGDWKNLYMTLCTLVKLGQYLREREVNFGLVKERLTHFGEDLSRLSAVLIEMIDFQESSAENRMVVNKGHDPDLDKLKRDYERLPVVLTEVARIEAEEFYISQCSVAYLPILGYLLMVPETERNPSNPNVRMVFSSDGMVYYKTPRMQDLDSQVGDIKMQIIDVETTISLRLQRLVLKNSKSVNKAVETAGVLDALTSLAAVARQYNWVRPSFSDESIMEITKARHPIAEHICKSGNFVPNPITSNEQCGKIKILTGPNASGKSVYLKTVGVIAYLSHVGSFVPASRAVIGPLNRIMSRMYTIDSVLDGLSSFANDLKQMSNAIRKSDQNSLIIIDEFGKGTVTEVGLSLLASCLNWWLEGPMEKLPHVFVASHFYALKSLLVESERQVRFQTMDVLRNADGTLEFQYKLVDGIIDMSYASLTALKMGIPKEVVDRSEEVYLHLRCGGSLTDLALPATEGEDNHRETDVVLQPLEREEKSEEPKKLAEEETQEKIEQNIVNKEQKEERDQNKGEKEEEENFPPNEEDNITI